MESINCRLYIKGDKCVLVRDRRKKEREKERKKVRKKDRKKERESES